MATATNTANRFDLRCKGTQVIYSTSSFAGPPQLQYAGPEGELSFSGEQIATQSSPFGTEVTVTLESIPDLRTLTATLLLPSFNLDESNTATFDTLLVKTTSHTTIAGPPTGPGQTYEALELHGTAEAVEF